jgi:hypothetical protein
MGKSKNNKTVGKVHFDNNLKAYQLRINSVSLESDSANQFNVRKNELQKINVRLLPEKVDFILHDETSNVKSGLVKVKLILQRIGPCDFLIRFKEFSESKAWKDFSSMKEYYAQRVLQLGARQFQDFDLVVDSNYMDQSHLVIKYSVQIANIVNQQIFKLIMEAIDAIHNSAESINNPSSGDVNNNMADEISRE